MPLRCSENTCMMTNDLMGVARVGDGAVSLSGEFVVSFMEI